MRSRDKEVNKRFTALLTERNDLRIGQMIINALKQGGKFYSRDLPSAMENYVFYIEDRALLELIEKMLRENK